MLSYQVYVLLVWKVCFASLDLMSEAMICVRVPESVLLTCGNQSVLNKMAWSSGAEGLVGCNASYLVLHNVTIEDSGMYTCKVGSLQPSVHFLNVHGSDELYASGSVGDCIHLPCGTGSRDIMQWGTSKWFKTEGSRELEIETNDTFIPTREFLVIKNLTQDHIGWYHCHHGNTRKRVFVALANHNIHLKPCQFQWDVPNPPSDCSRNQCHVKSCPAHKTSWQHFIDGRYWVIVATVACCFIVFGILLRLVHKWHRRKVLQEKLRTERTVRFHSSLFGNDSTLNINQYMTSPATQANGNDLDNRAYINNEEEDSDNVSYENVELRCTGLKVNQATIQLFNSNLYSDSKHYLEPESPVENEEDRMSEETTDGDCYEEVDDEKQETLQKHPPLAKSVRPSASPQGGSSSDSDGDCYEEVDDEKQETSEKHPPLAKCVHPSASPQGGSSSDSDGDCYENMSELGKDTLQDENLDDGHSYEDMEGWSKKEPQESAPCSSSAQDGRSSDTDSDCYVNMDQKTELDDLSDEYEDMKDSVCGVLKKEDKELIDSEEDDNDGYVEMNESIYVAPRSATISTTGMSSNCQVGPSQGGSMRHESLKRHRSK
nr:PREDICTED: uncharacterized protein LOC102364148 [Latimeria chalumnae]|eukprot:XP_014349960.1 PREDICTED: uncharacterized protein LOC102364148 [Latimeria chalumnae]